MTGSRLLLILAGTALVLGCLALGLLRLLSRSLMFPGCAVPALTAESASNPRVEVVSYETEDGLSLRGLRVSCGRAGAPVVLYFHGNAEAVIHNLPVGLALAELGFDTFLAEYRGYAGLPGERTEQGFLLDGRAALAALTRSGVRADRLVIVGRSLGTGVAVDLATRVECRHVVLVSPFTSMVDMGRTLVGPLAPLVVKDRFDSLSRAAGVRSLSTVYHGTVDEVIPFAQGRRLAAALPGARFVPLRGVGHNDLEDVARLIVDAVSGS